MIVASITHAASRRLLQARPRPIRLTSAALTRCNFSTDASMQTSEAAERPKAKSPFYHHAKRRMSPDELTSSRADVSTQANILFSTNLLKQRLAGQEMFSDENQDTAAGDNTYWKKRNRNRHHRKDHKSRRWKDSKIKGEQVVHSKEENSNDEKRHDLMDVTTSDWLLVSNIPHISKLSDVLSSLSSILKFEVEKGILNLDELDSKDAECYQRLKQIDALHSLYTTQELTPENNLPLVKLDLDPEQSLPSQLIAEARLHLSYRARPTGWFLRFANRSIAHAVRCHINEADRHQAIIREQHDIERKEIREERKDWISGLSLKVRNECLAQHPSKNNSLAMKDSLAEKELMWGEDLVHGKKSVEADDSSFGGDGDAKQDDYSEDMDEAINVSEEQPNDKVNTFYDEYAQSRPYPMHSTSMPSVESVFGFHRLRCGSKILRVREFSPSPIASKRLSPMDSWDQHSFHLSNVLELSDSVVRVETHGLNTTTNNVKYLFRAYDFESIYPDPSGSREKLADSFTELPKSIGWNVLCYESSDVEHLPHRAVDLLVQGQQKQWDRRQQERTGQTQLSQPTNHTFLIRFASSSDARMAVREMQGTMYNERPMTLTQYPSAVI